jgi:hypothetical protein
MDLIVYDPINLENIHINDYLNNDNNNIVVVFNNKAYGVNKTLFMFNNEMKRCIISNKALLKQTTYDNPDTYYNLGYFIGKKAIVNQKTLNNVLEKQRVVELTSKTTGNTYISKELLELTTIGILKQSENSIEKANFKYAYEDVYFDELISKLLEEYSWMLYEYINNNLLNPQIYNNKEELEYSLVHILKYDLKVRYKKFFKNIDFKKALDKVIIKIDKAFIEAAPRYENTYTKTVFYRGMKTKYINTNGSEFDNIGDTALIVTYSSISSSYAEAKKFAGMFPTSDAAIYKIYLEEGLPCINMVSTARLKEEEEFLLPRNIIFELISKKGNEYTVLAKPFKPDQFTIKTGCISLDYYDIVPTKLSAPNAKKSNVNSGKNKGNIIPVKLKRCPKGTVRDKVTNECVPKNHFVNSVNAKPTPKSMPKLGRCPKGTRRNPKTLLCEAKVLLVVDL